MPQKGGVIKVTGIFSFLFCKIAEFRPKGGVFMADWGIKTSAEGKV